jgi:type 2 lantibiotic biosynthesis protein LanM
LDRGAYGWAEFVANLPCASAAEVERFYFRQGGYLALFYLLGATDVHGENIIASGEHPVVIDAEALLVGFANQAEADAFSVRNTLMLPEGHEDPELRDLSGIGKGAGQLAASPMTVWTETGTDTMRLTRKQARIAGFQNRPTLAGVEVDTDAYREAVVQGFTEAYRLLAQHRDEILAPGGLLDAFAEDEIRVVPRPSSLYLAILEESFHPGVLGDAMDRERLYDRLWLELEEGRAYGPQVIEAERADLWYGDIPIFTSRPCDLDMRTSLGEPLPGFFTVTGMDAARKRIRGLSEEDLERQLAEIRSRL